MLTNEFVLQVTVTAWQTSNAVLQVCSQTVVGDSPQLLNCADVPKSSQGQPVAVAIAPGDNIQIVMVTKNLSGKDGDAVLIDDVHVDYKPCSDTHTDAPPPPGPGPATAPPTSGGPDKSLCNVKCDFESSSTCSFVASSGGSGGQTQEFGAQKGQYKNRLTGIKGRECDHTQ